MFVIIANCRRFILRFFFFRQYPEGRVAIQPQPSTERATAEENNKKKGKWEINGNGIISAFALITLMIRFCESKRDEHEDEQKNGLWEAYTPMNYPSNHFHVASDWRAMQVLIIPII